MTNTPNTHIALLVNALQRALIEIHNPGANRAVDFDIVEHIHAVLKEVRK